MMVGKKVLMKTKWENSPAYVVNNHIAPTAVTSRHPQTKTPGGNPPEVFIVLHVHVIEIVEN